MGTFIKTLLIVLAFVVGGAALAAWSGFVGGVLWGWFLVPLGVKAISAWHAIGLSLLANWFLMGKATTSYDDKKWYVPVSVAFLAPLLLLTFGWVIIHWIGI